MDNTRNLIEQGFKPLLGTEPKVLILGTMPSVQSLKTQQYYGHPRNAFWWIMSELFGFDYALSYLDRVDCITKKQVAVWDVIASCHRPGSLDSNIDQHTLTPNCLSELIASTPSLRLIAFNGQVAQKLFKKFIGEQAWQGDIVILPSTSPANAGMTKEDKLCRWSKITEYLA